MYHSHVSVDLGNVSEQNRISTSKYINSKTDFVILLYACGFNPASLSINMEFDCTIKICPTKFDTHGFGIYQKLKKISVSISPSKIFPIIFSMKEKIYLFNTSDNYV